VVEEGMINSSPIVDESAGSSTVRGGIADVVEATEGEIIATSIGTNFFAFSMKVFISSRMWPWEEFTFSQSKSTPWARESAIAPSAPRFRESPLS
jgi:hypothetical protein